MKLSYKWLKEFVDIELTPQEIAERLTMAGIEVTAVTSMDKGIKNVVTAEVRTVSPHPNADKLTYCTVYNGKEELAIVCGAKNIKPGNRIPLALVGGVLPGNKEIYEAEIRGKKSFGMMCSERELGLSEEHGGIMILPSDMPLGIDINKVLELDDVILEVEPTPNRGDVLSVMGAAREVAAFLDVKLKTPRPAVRESSDSVEKYVTVDNRDSHLCPRYAARYVGGVKVGPSPMWLQNRLRNCGLRPINNIVDITNYVLLELGHPLHAFDYDKLSEHKIVIRTAGKGEEITTLDGKTRKLSKDMLVIADADKPVALAGIMGGECSSVTEETKNVLLESAYFDPVVIRKTARRLGISSDSSYRFERGVDSENLLVALDRISQLIGELAGGQIAKGIFDVYSHKIKSKKITLRQDRINEILGLNIPFNHTKELLRNLGFVFTENQATETVQAVAPPWRHDIEREIDLVEEVARLNGYEEIPATSPKGSMVRISLDSGWEQESQMRLLMKSLGFFEVVSYSFVSDKDSQVAGDPEATIRIANPLTEETSVMRTSLLSCLLKKIAGNLNHGNTFLKLFELGRVFHRCTDKEKASLPPGGKTFAKETKRIAFAVTSPKDQKVLYKGEEKSDIFSLKGVVECFLREQGVSNSGFRPLEREFLYPGVSLEIVIESEPIGYLGKISSAMVAKYDLVQDVYAAELDIDKIVSLASHKCLYQSIPRVPGVRRDVAFLLPETISYEQVMTTMKAKAHSLVKEIVLFDVYQGESIEAGYKSYAFTLLYQAPDRTLQDKEVNSWHQEFVQHIEKELGAKVR